MAYLNVAATLSPAPAEDSVPPDAILQEELKEKALEERIEAGKASGELSKFPGF